jgi:hypothetical protein
MKLSITILLLLLPVSVFAQNYPGAGAGGMSQTDMQNMMEKAQEMQLCMQGLDQSKLQQLEPQARQFEAEIKALCSSGKRDEAQDEAISFAREMRDDPDIQKIRECSEHMSGMLPQMPFMDQADNTDSSSSHVCDQ